MDLVEIIKWVCAFLVIPGVAFLIKSVLTRLQTIEERQTDTEKDVAVIQSQMNDVRRDIHEIKDGINKLIEKLL